MNLSNCIRVFVVEGRDTLIDNNITWMKRGKVLRRFEDIEKTMLIGLLAHF